MSKPNAVWLESAGQPTAMLSAISAIWSATARALQVQIVQVCDTLDLRNIFQEKKLNVKPGIKVLLG